MFEHLLCYSEWFLLSKKKSEKKEQMKAVIFIRTEKKLIFIRLSFDEKSKNKNSAWSTVYHICQKIYLKIYN